MPIEFACVCGKQFKARDDYAGRRFLCASCQAEVVVPVPDAVDLGIATDAPPPPHRPAPAPPAPWKIDGEDLARVIAKGIAIEREERRHQKRWRFSSELLLALVMSFAFFAMSNQHPQGATCFVVALVGLAIVARLRP